MVVQTIFMIAGPCAYLFWFYNEFPQRWSVQKKAWSRIRLSFAFQLLHPAEEKTVWVDYLNLKGCVQGIAFHDKIAERHIPQTVLRHGKLLRMMVEGMSNSISLTLMVDYQLLGTILDSIHFEHWLVQRTPDHSQWTLGTYETRYFFDPMLCGAASTGPGA